MAVSMLMRVASRVRDLSRRRKRDAFRRETALLLNVRRAVGQRFREHIARDVREDPAWRARAHARWRLHFPPRLAGNVRPFGESHHGRHQRASQAAGRIARALERQDIRGLVGLRVLPGMAAEPRHREPQQHRPLVRSHERHCARVSSAARAGPCRRHRES